MSTEQIEPQAEELPPVAAAETLEITGPENEGSEHAPAAPQRRRRRRRRKGKGTAAPAEQQQPMQQRPPQQQPRQKSQQPRFQQKNAQPGNQQAAMSNGNGRGKKQKKQRAPKVFVGPMDHSYRAVNGNVADASPSTVGYMANGNGNGNFYQDYNASYGAMAARPVIAEDAPTRIYCFIEDLFFLAKIQETAKKTGVKVSFLKGADKEVLSQLIDAPEESRPALIVFDLNNANIKPLTIIPKLKSKLKKETSIIGFLSHLQGDLKLKAMEAGCDTVMPRSAFSQGLPNLLRRYGMEEEEDSYPQPV